MKGRGRVESVFARARAGQLAAVLGELRAALAQDPADTEGWLALGLVLADHERWAEAVLPLERALASPAPPLVARVTLARALENGGRLGEARAQLESARDAAPGHVGVARALAAVLRRAGDFDAADRELAAASAAATEGERALLAGDRGDVAHARGDLGAALALWGEASERDPARAEPRLAAAEALAEVGDFAGALAAVGAVLDRDDAHPAAVRMRASLVRARAHARTARLIGRPREAVAARADLRADLDGAGAIAALFGATPATTDPRAVIDAAARFLAEAVGVPPTAAGAAYALARIAGDRPLDLDDLQVSAEARDGVAGLRVSRREDR